MDLLQKVKHFLLVIFQDILIHLIVMVKWDPFYAQVMGKYNIFVVEFSLETVVCQVVEIVAKQLCM